MSKCVGILVTMDTKGAEADLLRSEIDRLGGKSLLIDMSVVGDTARSVDVSAADVAAAGGTALARLRDNPNRTDASAVMVRGATAIVHDLIAQGRLHSLISLGGTQGTNNASKVMQDLPYGFPKLIVSTLAAGNTAPYVGIKDISMMFSVGDILGLNPLLRMILSNAAGAAFGMAQAYGTRSRHAADASARPMIALTNLGVLTQGAMRAIRAFEEKGFETIVFHAVGSGGKAMEQLVKDGLVAGVFDYGLGDVADAVHGGLRAADQERLRVAGRLGVPQVVVPGGIDHLGIQLAEPDTVPEKYRNHLYSYHNPVILVPRPDPLEMRAIVAEIADRLTEAHKDTVFLMPLAGVSSYSAKGGALHDSAGDEAMRRAFAELLPRHIERIEIDANAEDEVFIHAAVERLVAMIGMRH